MADGLPSAARVVIVGGGIAGCSLAYNLTKLGVADVVLLEQGTLTCGTTWHAAGLVNQLRASHTLTSLSREGIRVYAALEAETGQATGLKRNGSMPVARTPERLHELQRLASLAKVFGIDAGMISPAEARQHHPLLSPERIVGAMWIPGDGQVNPVDTAQALAKGARSRGARIFERTKVTAVEAKAGRVAGVTTDRGAIACEVLVNCAGIWAPRIGALAGVSVPLHACEHMYVTTAPLADATAGLPILRDTDGYCYVKEDAGKLVVGCFEPRAKPLPLEALPAGFEFGELPEDWDHFALPFARAMELLPVLEQAQIRHFMNGPESFTPDNKFLMGEAPELRNFYVSAGFNSQGILYGAGAGRALAEWIIEGEPTMDLAEVDIARFHPFQGNRRYLHDRVRESLGLLYAMHWPHRQVESARPVRRTPLHDRVAALNACFGELAGWERANWYAPAGVAPAYEYSYGRQNWFGPVGEEHKAVREAVGLLDLSSFGKILVQGRDAERELQRICSRDIAVAPGRVVYSCLLTQRGGINSDLTVTRLDEGRFMLVTATASLPRDLAWIRRHLAPDAHVSLTDMTSAFAVIAVMGPRSRALLQELTEADLSNEAFPFGTARTIDLGYAPVLAQRVTFVGELGWELHVPSEFAGPVFDRLREKGAAFGLRPAGYHALDSLRIEKGYRHWGHDIGPADTPFEAGLGFTVSLDKTADFIGGAALRRRSNEQPTRRLVHVRLHEAEPMLFHDEPILQHGRLVGRVTSGAFGYTFGRSIGMGYIEHKDGPAAALVAAGGFAIEIAGTPHGADVALRPFYDPTGDRLRM